MNLAFLAARLGRSTRLTFRTTNRQHLRDKARQKSTNSGAKGNGNAESIKKTSMLQKPSGAVQEMLSYAYGSVKIPFRVYSGMQQRRPYLTQLETSLVIYFLGDLSAQYVQTDFFTEGRYEPIRALRAMVIGGISSIPNYNWFLWLGRNFNYSAHWKSLAVKIVVSQMCFTPVSQSSYGQVGTW